MSAMNSYDLEYRMLQRRDELARTAEESSRLQGWRSRPMLSHRVAASLRLLADRLDGHTAAPIVPLRSA